MGLLKDCHTNNPFLRYLGTCNDAKLVLNKCFRAEVRPDQTSAPRSPRLLTPSSSLPSQCPTLQRIERGKINLDLARAKRSELEKKWKDIELEA